MRTADADFIFPNQLPMAAFYGVSWTVIGYHILLFIWFYQLLKVLILTFIAVFRAFKASPPVLPPFYDKPAFTFETREELFDAFLPMVYAHKRPRRHGYEPGFETTMLLVYKLELPINELQSLRLDRTNLKLAVKRMKDTTRNLISELEEGREGSSRDILLNDKPKPRDVDLGDLKDTLVKKIKELDAGFLFRHEVALIMCT